MKSKDDYLSHLNRINFNSKEKVQKDILTRTFTSQQVLNLYRYLLNAINSGLVIYEYRAKWYVSDYKSRGTELDSSLVEVMTHSLPKSDLAKLSLIRDYTSFLQETILDSFDFSIFLDRNLIKWLAIRLQHLLINYSISTLIPTSLEAEKLLYLVYSFLDFKIVSKTIKGDSVSYFSIYDYNNENIRLTLVPSIDVQDIFVFSLKNTKYSII